jgi:predicted MPP superfamily phosphohydrolase
MNKVLQEKDKKKMIINISIVAVIAIAVLLYARFIGTTGLHVKEYKVLNNIIPDNFYGLKIAHITDIHYGRVINKKEMNDLVEKINLQKPDIVVLTGDLLDRDIKPTIDTIAFLKESLNNIKVTIGKYAIMGNHDYAHNEWKDIITEGGFVDIDDSYELIYKDANKPILITGISTNLKIITDIDTKMKDVNAYLGSIPVEENNSLYKILLLHEPDYIDAINGYNLVLAGHSHNGQIRIPIVGAVILPPGAKKYYKPYYELDNANLYISSGVGTSTWNLRLFNRPSFNLYRLVNK